MQTFYLVRHALTDWNEEDRFQGVSDIPLNQKGREQALALSRRLANMSINGIISSDLLRARETARIITQFYDLDLILDSRLREMDFGLWEGMTYDEVKAEYPERAASWEQNWTEVTTPDGENFQGFTDRVHEFCQESLLEQQPGDVLVVAHGGSLGVVLCFLMGLNPERYWQFDMALASISVVKLFESGAVLNRLNDLAHLSQDA